MWKIFFCAGMLNLSAAAAMDLPQFIDEEVAEGKTTVVIPPGRYPVIPEDGVHLRLENLSDITIDATDVEMVCTETTLAVWVDHCTNLTIRGLTIDYDPLPFTQGRIVSISDDRRVHDVELFDGYPDADSAIEFKYEIYRPDARTLRYSEYHHVDVEVLSPKKIQVVKQASEWTKQGGERVGDLIVIGSQYAPGGRTPHAVMTTHSVNTQLEKISLYASNSFGFFEKYCDRTVYQNCVIDRRAPESDPISREDPRLRSLNADAYHSKFATHGPQLMGCTAFFMADDAVNINGSYHLIIESQKNVLQVLAKREMDIQPGDSVMLIDQEGVPFPSAVVRSVKNIGPVTEEERTQVRAFEILPQVQELLNDRFQIELDRAVDLRPGSVISSEQRVGNGLKVAGCRFGFNRSRGILIKAGNGEVRGNVVEQCGMQAILIAPEYEWLEAGLVQNLDVVDNVVIDSGRQAVWVRGIKHGRGHKNITLSGNRFVTDYLPAVAVSGVEGLALQDNTLNGFPIVYEAPKVAISGMVGSAVR